MKKTLILVLAAGFGGCETQEGESLPDDVLTYDAYITAFERADCERRQRCEAPPPFDDVEACLAAIAPDLRRARQRIASSVALGRTTYDRAAADECLETVRGACSQDPVDVLAACNVVIEGTLAEGEGCLGHFECAPSAEVERPFCFEGCTGLFGSEETAGSGQCVAASPIGTPACP
jgi:hypothetical protein